MGEILENLNVKRQDIFVEKSVKAVRVMNYYPCYIQWISQDKSRMLIKYGKWSLEIPSSMVRTYLGSC
jgi:hypothetical protein